MTVSLTALATLMASATLIACGEDSGPSPTTSLSQPRTTTQRAPPRPEPAATLAPARCPAGLTNCRAASGRIAYVERVDPDGDGDAHFVLLDSESVTAPGFTVVDVRRDLRPHPLPGVGDALSAAGPVHTGSYGQRQIEAVAVSAAR